MDFGKILFDSVKKIEHSHVREVLLIIKSICVTLILHDIRIALDHHVAEMQHGR